MKSSVFDRRVIVLTLLYCLSMTVAIVGEEINSSIMQTAGAISAAAWIYGCWGYETWRHRRVSRETVDRWRVL